MSATQVSTTTKHSAHKTLVSAAQAVGCPWEQCIELGHWAGTVLDSSFLLPRRTCVVKKSSSASACLSDIAQTHVCDVSTASWGTRFSASPLICAQSPRWRPRKHFRPCGNSCLNTTILLRALEPYWSNLIKFLVSSLFLLGPMGTCELLPLSARPARPSRLQRGWMRPVPGFARRPSPLSHWSLNLTRTTVTEQGSDES
jgi:hypothetical protein